MSNVNSKIRGESRKSEREEKGEEIESKKKDRGRENCRERERNIAKVGVKKDRETKMKKKEQK